MSIREWDRKVRFLHSEVSSFISQRGNAPGQGEQELIKKIRRIKKWQYKLETNLTFIHSLVRRKHFLSIQEKSLLHWASEFSVKTQAYYREYITGLNTLLWAKLVQTRSLSITSDPNDILAQGGEESLIKAYQQQLQQTRLKLETYHQALVDKKSQLRQRYESLVVCHVNDEAHNLLRLSSHHLTPVSPYLLSVKDRISQQRAAPYMSMHQKISAETKKMAHLTTTLQTARSGSALLGPAATSPTAFKVDCLLQKFDYMNLEGSQAQPPPSFRS